MSKSRKEQLEELLAFEPDDPFLRYGLALEHASAGNDSQAAQVMLELIARIPNYIPAYLQAGQILLRLDQEGEAKDVLTKGIEAARKAGEDHALGEMSSLLASLG